MFPIVAYLLLALVGGWWLARTDLPTALAPAGSCHAVHKNRIVPCIVAGVSLGLLLQHRPLPVASDAAGFAVIAAALCAAVAAGRLVSPHASPVFALGGAVAGYRLFIEGTSALLPAIPVAWIAAPVVAALLAALVCRPCSALIARSETHYLRLMWRCGIVVTLLAGAMLVAAGYNLGLLFGALPAAPETLSARLLPPAALALGALCNRRTAADRTSRLLEQEFDIHAGIAAALLIAVTLTLLLFSSDTLLGIIGLHAAPLSPAMLTFAALAGCGIALRRDLVEHSTLIRLAAAALITPIVGLLCGYFFAAATGADGRPTSPETYMLLLGLVLLAVTTLLIHNLLHTHLAHRSSGRVLIEQEEQLTENRRSLNRLEIRAMQTENEQLHNLLELKRREVMSIALNINEQKEFTDRLYEQIKAVEAESDPAEKNRLLGELRSDLNRRMNFSNEIDGFYTQVEQLHRDFCIRLTEQFPRLTEQERRLTILLRLGFSTKYIATLMNISPKSAEIGRHRLRTKLGLQRQQNLAAFIKTI